jgi:membrane dipeptidase
MPNDPERRFGVFDFGMTPEEEARAARLHKESIIVDMLYWGPSTKLSITHDMEQELQDYFQQTHDYDAVTMKGIGQPAHWALKGKFPQFHEDWAASGVTAGNRSIEFLSLPVFAATAGRHIAAFDKLDWMTKALCAADIRRAKVEGKFAGWINTQLANGFDRNFIDLLEPAYDLGLRMVMLTYNQWNLIGAGCTERTDAGISNYGEQVVQRLNELGILVDTGHCGRQTTLDACTLSKKPAIASHTAAKGAYDHARAKTDEELLALARTGGVIGVYGGHEPVAGPSGLHGRSGGLGARRCRHRLAHAAARLHSDGSVPSGEPAQGI